MSILSGNIFQGEKVRLTAMHEDDIETLLHWFQDAEYLRLYDARPAYPRDVKGVEQWMTERRETRNDWLFGIRLLDGEGLIGLAEIDGIVWQHGVAAMSLGIGDRVHRQRGSGYEAGQLLLKFAFHELNLHRITATVFSYNSASLALTKKLGFTEEGVQREWLQRDGERYDMHWFGMLHHEWAAIQDDNSESQNS